MPNDQQSRRLRIGRALREVLVIVAGVSIALGGDAAYDSLQARGQRRALVAGMLDDLGRDSLTLQTITEILPTVATATSGIISVIEEPGEVEPIEFAVAIRQSIYLPMGQKESATYRGMMSTGALSLIIDPALRRSILKCYASPALGVPAEIWGGFLNGAHDTYDRRLRGILGRHYVSIMGCNGTRGEIAACIERSAPEIDLNRMRTDEELIGALAGVLSWTSGLEPRVKREEAARAQLVGDLLR